MESKQLELIVDSNDEATLKAIEASFTSVKVERGEKARVIDPVTVLAIAAGVVHLVNELLALQEKLKQQKKAPTVTVRNLRGDSVKLANATPEQLYNLLKESSEEE